MALLRMRSGRLGRSTGQTRVCRSRMSSAPQGDFGCPTSLRSTACKTPPLIFTTRLARNWVSTVCTGSARAKKGLIPDCLNITQTLTQHATWLTEAGVDYIALDATNLDQFSSFSDLIQLRPAQVVFEEWSALRKNGTATPQVVAWPAAWKGATLFQRYLDLYNDPAYDDLVFRDSKSGKKVMFYVNTRVDPQIVQEMESNGGRNDVVAVPMWAEFPVSDYSDGVWGFFSPCTTGGSSARYTSTVIYNDNPRHHLGLGCLQYETPSSKIGSETSAAPSYQLGYGSLFGGSPGKLDGGTHLLQWARVFETQPEHVFMSSWNEWIAQPQKNPYASNRAANSVGLEGDPAARWLWVDTYGAEYSRDLEPSVEYGDLHLRIMAACISIYKAGGSCAQPAHSSSLCCQANNASSAFPRAWNNIWSAISPDGDDFLLTNSNHELVIITTKEGWRQVCSCFAGPSAFCVDSGEPLQTSGPFMLLAEKRDSGTLLPLYRCFSAAASRHFFSLSPACRGLGKAENVLGFVSRTRTSFTPRTLHQCWTKGSAANSAWATHSLDVPCSSGVDTVLGYVR
jgi:hypothetical protein